MKILILEDDHVRHHCFKEQLADHELTIVETTPEAIEKLESEAWDWLFLDHDLGGEVFVESGAGTGYEVACWLEEHEERYPAMGVALHTANPAGAYKMQQALPKARQIPGLWLIDKDTLNGYLSEPQTGTDPLQRYLVN